MAGLRELTERQRRDANMIRDPGSWPLGALLLKRDTGKSIQLAFMVNSRPLGLFRLFIGDAFDVVEGTHIPYEDFSTAEEIVTKGWEVD